MNVEHGQERAASASAAARPRVLLTKIGLDGHDRGARLVATWLRDAGMEVIYTGPWQPLERVVQMAQGEGVSPALHAEAQLGLARALESTGGDVTRARTLAREATAIYRKLGKEYQAQANRAEAWLAQR